VAGDPVAAILAVFFSRQESYLFFKDTIKVKNRFLFISSNLFESEISQKLFRWRLTSVIKIKPAL
jgi:hypothetical protein